MDTCSRRSGREEEREDREGDTAAGSGGATRGGLANLGLEPPLWPPSPSPPPPSTTASSGHTPSTSLTVLRFRSVTSGSAHDPSPATPPRPPLWPSLSVDTLGTVKVNGNAASEEEVVVGDAMGFKNTRSL